MPARPEHPKLNPLAFGQSRAFVTSNLELLGDMASQSGGVIQTDAVLPLDPTISNAASISPLLLGDAFLIAGSSTGVRMENVRSPTSPGVAVLLPTYGRARATAWGGAIAEAGKSMGILANPDQGTDVEGLYGETITLLRRERIREVWEAMIGADELDKYAFPDIDSFNCIPTRYGQVDFKQAFHGAYKLVDSYKAQSAALLKLNVDDMIYRTLAAALTPAFFWPDDAELTWQKMIKRAGLDAICDRLRDDPSAPLSLTQMEKISGYSRRSLQYAFRERFGMSPIAWQNNERLLIAREILQRENGLAISQVAQRVGFASTSSFSNSFKVLYGISPSKIRARVT
jgi:AraC-like DNA-binding protein